MDFQSCLKNLGRNLKAARIRAGFKQRDVEDQIGLTYRHYQEIEAGRINLTLETLYRLARLYRTEIREFFRID